MCEAAYSDWTVSLTLTYAPRDDGADKILTPRHFQSFIRALRDAHLNIRYLVAGEYGDLKGRAHFHVLLFGKGDPPTMPDNKQKNQKQGPWPYEQRFWIPEWPHGHCFMQWVQNETDGNGVTVPEEKPIRYVCKYLLKNEKGKFWFSLSKKPTLGWEFFADKAALSAELNVLPSTFTYWPPNASRDKQYLMTGATKRDFLSAVVDAWRDKRPLYACRLAENIAEAVEKIDIKRREEAEANIPTPLFMEKLRAELDLTRPTSQAVNRSLLDGMDFSDYC